jgi:hypothetical protein
MRGNFPGKVMPMSAAGYSSRPLAAKLGLKPGMRVHLCDPPASYLAALEPALAQTEIFLALMDALDFIHLFANDRATVATRMPALVAALAPAGMLWVSWPKRAAKVPTDLTETIVRDLGLALGVVDVKVAAIDATWSALKFVRRLKDR